MNEYIVEIIYSQYGEGTVFKEKLVRCKDCKYMVQKQQCKICHRLINNAAYHTDGYLDAVLLVVHNEDYCCWAERKE